MNNYDVDITHMYPNMNLYGYVDTDIIARRKAMLNAITYNVAYERVNVELSEYAAYNPYC